MSRISRFKVSSFITLKRLTALSIVMSVVASSSFLDHARSESVATDQAQVATGIGSDWEPRPLTPPPSYQKPASLLPQASDEKPQTKALPAKPAGLTSAQIEAKLSPFKPFVKRVETRLQITKMSNKPTLDRLNTIQDVLYGGDKFKDAGELIAELAKLFPEDAKATRNELVASMKDKNAVVPTQSASRSSKRSRRSRKASKVSKPKSVVNWGDGWEQASQPVQTAPSHRGFSSDFDSDWDADFESDWGHSQSASSSQHQPNYYAPQATTATPSSQGFSSHAQQQAYIKQQQQQQKAQEKYYRKQRRKENLKNVGKGLGALAVVGAAVAGNYYMNRGNNNNVVNQNQPWNNGFGNTYYDPVRGAYVTQNNFPVNGFNGVQPFRQGVMGLYGVGGNGINPYANPYARAQYQVNPATGALMPNMGLPSAFANTYGGVGNFGVPFGYNNGFNNGFNNGVGGGGLLQNLFGGGLF